MPNAARRFPHKTPQGASLTKRRKALPSQNAARRFPHKTPQGAPKRNHHNHSPDQLYQQSKLNEFIDKVLQI
jgi:hypothetical protein